MKWSDLEKMSKFTPQMFYTKGYPGQSFQIFWLKLTYSFCKLDHFSAVGKNSVQ